MKKIIIGRRRREYRFRSSREKQEEREEKEKARFWSPGRKRKRRRRKARRHLRTTRRLRDNTVNESIHRIKRIIYNGETKTTSTVFFCFFFVSLFCRFFCDKTDDFFRISSIKMTHLSWCCGCNRVASSSSSPRALLLQKSTSFRRGQRPTSRRFRRESFVFYSSSFEHSAKEEEEEEEEKEKKNYNNNNGSISFKNKRNEIDDVLFSFPAANAADNASSSSQTKASKGKASKSFPVEAEILVEDDVNDDYEEWEKNVSKEARKKWNDVSKEIGEETTFTVGKKDLDEKFLSEVLLYLFKSNDQNVPAHLFLNKIKRSMTLDGYKAILVGCGRANKWELCEQIIDFVKKETKESEKESSLDGIVTANWFVAIIDARIKEKSFADVASCFEKMFEFKCQPSGAAIESFARFTDFEYEFDDDLKERAKDIYEWLVDTDAGKALWPTYFGEAGVDNLPGKNSKSGKTKTIRVAMEAMDVDLGGDIEKLQEKLSDFY